MNENRCEVDPTCDQPTFAIRCGRRHCREHHAIAENMDTLAFLRWDLIWSDLKRWETEHVQFVHLADRDVYRHRFIERVKRRDRDLERAAQERMWGKPAKVEIGTGDHRFSR